MFLRLHVGLHPLWFRSNPFPDTARSAACGDVLLRPSCPPSWTAVSFLPRSDPFSFLFPLHLPFDLLSPAYTRIVEPRFCGSCLRGSCTPLFKTQPNFPLSLPWPAWRWPVTTFWLFYDTSSPRFFLSGWFPPFSALP